MAIDTQGQEKPKTHTEKKPSKKRKKTQNKYLFLNM